MGLGCATPVKRGVRAEPDVGIGILCQPAQRLRGKVKGLPRSEPVGTRDRSPGSRAHHRG